MKSAFRKIYLLPVIFSLILTAVCEAAVDEPTQFQIGCRAGTKPAPARDRQALLDHYFEILKDRDVNYKVIGFVLEELARVQIRSLFSPDKYIVLGGLQYEEAGGRTAGELDIMVQDRRNGRIVLVAEVKLSGDLARAGRKASEQLNRFRDYLSDGRISRFRYPAEPWRRFYPSQFSETGQYWRIGNTGALRSGFDYEIDLRRHEADLLQDRLLARQGHGGRKSGPEAAPAAPAGVPKPFIGNLRSKVLHYHTCTSPPAPHNRIYFSSIEEARRAGYTRLHSCIPAHLR